MQGHGTWKFAQHVDSTAEQMHYESKREKGKTRQYKQLKAEEELEENSAWEICFDQLDGVGE